VTGLGSGANNVLNQAADFVAGVADLNALGMKYTGVSGSGTFTATSAVGSKTGTSAATVLNPGALDHFVFTMVDQQNTASFTGVNTITAQDASNNVITTFDASVDNVTITSSLGGTISGLGSGSNNILNQAADFVSGVADLTALSAVYTGTSGSGTFTATSGTLKTGVTGAVTITPGPLDHFVFSLTSPQNVDVAFTGVNTITAQDVSNNVITTFDASTDNVTITNTIGGTVTGLGSGSNNVLDQAGDFISGVANLTSLGLLYSGTSGTGTFTATSTVGGKTGTSGATVINPGPLDHFVFTIADPQQVGEIVTAVSTITAQDASNNVITTFDASADNVTITNTIGGTVTGLGSGDNNVLDQAGYFVAGVANLNALGMIYL